MRTQTELFEHELRDIYDAEHRLLDAMDRMTREATDERLLDGIRKHRTQSVAQIDRLERVFGLIGHQPSRERCLGAAGLIAEYERTIDEAPSPEIRNFVTAAAAVKAEHYEMVAYRSLILAAHMSGYRDVVRLLEDNLAEERTAAMQMGMMADTIAGRLGADDREFGPDGGLAGLLQMGVEFATSATQAGVRALSSVAPKPVKRSPAVKRVAAKAKPRTTSASRAKPRAAGARTTTARKATAARKATGARKATTARRTSTSRPAARRTTKPATAAKRKPATRKPATRARKTPTARRTTTRRSR